MTVTAAGKRRIASLNDERSSSVAASRDMFLLRSRRPASWSDYFSYNICKRNCLSIKSSERNLLVKRTAFRLSVDAQLLRLVGAQDLVQTFEFISVSAEPGRRPDGRAVLAAHLALRRHTPDLPGDGSALEKNPSAPKPPFHDHNPPDFA